MLLSFVDTTKPLRGCHKGVQTWCQTRAGLVSHSSILQNFTRFWRHIPNLGARFTSASCSFASSCERSTRFKHLMHYLNMLSLTHNFACTLRNTCLRIVMNVGAELVTLCMGDQSTLSRFTNDNSICNKPTLHAQNQIIPEQFQLKHSNWVTRHTLISLKGFSARLAHTRFRIQARLV